MKTLVLVFTGMTSAFLVKNWQSDQMTQNASQRGKQQVSKEGGVLQLLCFLPHAFQA
jgi:hypothetical protein